MPMTFSRFTPGDTRSLAAKMAEQERAAQVRVSNRQFLISVGVVMLALALFATFLILL